MKKVNKGVEYIRAIKADRKAHANSKVIGLLEKYSKQLTCKNTEDVLTSLEKALTRLGTRYDLNGNDFGWALALNLAEDIEEMNAECHQVGKKRYGVRIVRRNLAETINEVRAS